MKQRDRYLKGCVMVLLGVLMLMFGSCSPDLTKPSGSVGAGLPGIGTGSSGVSGSGGVSLEIEQFPASFWEGETYDAITLVLYNDQWHVIEDLEVKVSGVDRSLVSGLPDTLSAPKLNRASVQAPGIGTIKLGAMHFHDLTGDYQARMNFLYCYSAVSSHTEQVCIPRIGETSCQGSVSNNLDSNGPVSVRIDTIDFIGEKVRMTLRISNSNAGKAVNACFGRDDIAVDYSLDKVSLGADVGSCKPLQSEEYVLTNGETFVYCDFQRTSDDEYPTSLFVELSYLYEQRASKDFLVKKALE